MRYYENRFRNVSLAHFLRIHLPLFGVAALVHEFLTKNKKNLKKIWNLHSWHTFSRNTGVAQACNVKLIKLLNREWHNWSVCRAKAHFYVNCVQRRVFIRFFYFFFCYHQFSIIAISSCRKRAYKLFAWEHAGIRLITWASSKPSNWYNCFGSARTREK